MDNGAFLAAVQWISSFDAVTGTEADAADADGSFLHFRDVHHREADKIAVFCLQNQLIEVICNADGDDVVAICQLGGSNGTLGDIKFTAFDKLQHTCLCYKQQHRIVNRCKTAYVNDILAGAVIVAQVVQRNGFVTETPEGHISNLDQMEAAGICEDAGI